jgi:hypothetical protein
MSNRRDGDTQRPEEKNPIGRPTLPTRARAGARTVVLAGMGIAALGVATLDTSTFPTITTQ